MHDRPSTASTPEDRRVRTTRADFAFEALLADRLHSPTRKVFGWRHWWLTRTYERLRPLAGAWSAICTLATLPDHTGVRDVLPLLLDGLPAYHREGPAVLTGQGPVGFESAVVPPLGRGAEVSYGDNAWLGLALVAHQELCHDDVSVALVERLLQFTLSGWSADEGWARRGGIRSTANSPSTVGRSSTVRRTSTNGATAALGALVHRLTGDPAALEWALRIYRWTRGALLRDDGLYAARIEPDGTVASEPLTHNQGSMVGAGVLLAEVTGNPDFLADARATAEAAVGRFGLDELCENGPARNAVYFRNLLLLPSRAPSSGRGASPPRGAPADGAPTDGAPTDGRAPAPAPDGNGSPASGVLALAAAYDDLLWESRDRHSGMFAATGSPLSRMGALVQIDALLAGAVPHP